MSRNARYKVWCSCGRMNSFVLPADWCVSAFSTAKIFYCESCAKSLQLVFEPTGAISRYSSNIKKVERIYKEETAPDGKAASALSVQKGGDHYKKLKIQPIEYIHANNIPFPEGSVIKYVTRWRDKNGIADLEKAKHFLELLIELETKAAADKTPDPS